MVDRITEHVDVVGMHHVSGELDEDACAALSLMDLRSLEHALPATLTIDPNRLHVYVS